MTEEGEEEEERSPNALEPRKRNEFGQRLQLGTATSAEGHLRRLNNNVYERRNETQTCRRGRGQDYAQGTGVEKPDKALCL